MLTVDKVTKQFSKVRAVDALSFSVQPGEIFALLGPNGAGKTTTVRMIMQLMQPDSGRLIFDARLLHKTQVDRRLLGYLPEERGLYQDAPVLKTLVYLAGLRRMDALEARQKARYWLDRFALTERRNEKISTLSKGNQQKIQFIASILHNPLFAVLDEPFSGFDPINQELISEIIRELRDGGMTILLSAHQMQLIEQISDRILLLDQGKTMLSGTLEEIRRSTVADQKLLVTYQQLPDREIFDASASIKAVQPGENGTWEIFLHEETCYNDVLTDLTAAGVIHNLQTHQVNLHEIFIQSFRRDPK